MFCTSLRRRSSFASALPSLTSRTGLSLKENQLDTHDIALPLSHQSNQLNGKRRIIRFLLLSSTATKDSDITTTLARIHHFASLTGGADIALIMLLNTTPAITTARSLTLPSTDNNSSTDGVYAYSKLQAELFALTDVPNIPILLLSNISGLADLIATYSKTLAQPLRAKPTKTVGAVDILEYCTTEPPLPPLAKSLATDVFPSLDALAAEATAVQACGAGSDAEQQQWVSSSGGFRDEMQPGFAVLRGQLSENVVEGMIAFWEDEWEAE